MEKICDKLIKFTLFVAFGLPFGIIFWILTFLLCVSPILIWLTMNFFLIVHLFYGNVLSKPASYETESLIFYYIFCFLYIVADILLTLYGLKFFFKKK